MEKCDCVLCKFNNPKPTATAVIIKDQKILVGKRNLTGEPFFGEWDFFGGYLQENETPEETLKREIKEEIGLDCSLTFLGTFTGTASYQNFEFPVVTFAYLTEIDGEIKLDKKENSEYSWIPIEDLKSVAFDSNLKILNFLKSNFVFNLQEMKNLIFQLDSSAKVDEGFLYKAILNGFVSKIQHGGELAGMGWIFPRQTLLRKQAVVEDMIVNEKFRGMGYGEKILRDLIRWAKDQDIEVIELTTNPKRTAANSLYQKVGFKFHPTNHYLLKVS
jgi:8-oxo-dGTP pyrophosphatase MutT (NUDIX family)/GNAT superfamily N-acetyltransferase